MTRVSVGFFIRRSIPADDRRFDGKTMCAYGHELYPSRVHAEAALDKLQRSRWIDSRYVYDVAEAFMLLDGKP